MQYTRLFSHSYLSLLMLNMGNSPRPEFQHTFISAIMLDLSCVFPLSCVTCLKMLMPHNIISLTNDVVCRLDLCHYSSVFPEHFLIASAYPFGNYLTHLVPDGFP